MNGEGGGNSLMNYSPKVMDNSAFVERVIFQYDHRSQFSSIILKVFATDHFNGEEEGPYIEENH